MSASDWAALPRLIALVAFPVIGLAIAAAGIYLVVCTAAALWQRLVAFHRAGMARVARLADPTPLPGEDDGPCEPQRPCQVWWDSAADRGHAWVCDWHAPPGRHHAGDIHATVTDLAARRRR